MTALIASQKDLLACDLVLSADGGQYAEDQPALLVAFKGLAGIQIDVRGARTDLHSGFYDAVVPFSAEDRAAIAAVPFNERDFREAIGVDALLAEPGYMPQEHLAGRPTLEVNGIWGGFQGEGIKTVLPNEAHAKITCRLVPDQEPATIVELLARHVERHTPVGVRVTVHPLPGPTWCR